MNSIKNLLTSIFIICIISACNGSGSRKTGLPESITLTKQQLADKIKGGWAGQTIGCTYGGPVEFIYNGTLIQDYIKIEWPDGAIKKYYDTFPGLYDDVYMDMTFVNVFERLGIDAPADSIAVALARAKYPLWHANQAARYNILNGVMPPLSGNWLYNPHADDIDYQIEADFAGLMSPGMPNTSAEFSDKVGHIICHGDGWYGGVFTGAMYSLAFVTDKVDVIVTEALKTIPEKSTFYQCISDVIKWHKQYPADWKQTWFECQKKWSEDHGCPDGVFNTLDIDAKINSAYVVIGLLYGEGDYAKTLEISARCGQDADCNPATAGGILGTMLGYSQIPEIWKKNLYEVENRKLAYTELSLNDIYQISLKQALQVIEKNNGRINGDKVSITCQSPVPVKYEQSFEGHFPVKRNVLNSQLSNKSYEVVFTGNGAVLRGYVQCPDINYVAIIEASIDGKAAETILLPAAASLERRVDLFWKYQLKQSPHTISLKWLNPQGNASVNLIDALIYAGSMK